MSFKEYTKEIFLVDLEEFFLSRDPVSGCTCSYSAHLEP